MGSEHFLPLAQGTVELGLNLLSKTDDPELRKSCYGLFAALSTVLKGDMRNILPTLVETMLDALQSGEGIVVSISVKHSVYLYVAHSLLTIPLHAYTVCLFMTLHFLLRLCCGILELGTS